MIAQCKLKLRHETNTIECRVVDNIKNEAQLELGWTWLRKFDCIVINTKEGQCYFDDDWAYMHNTTLTCRWDGKVRTKEQQEPVTIGMVSSEPAEDVMWSITSPEDDLALWTDVTTTNGDLSTEVDENPTYMDEPMRTMLYKNKKIDYYKICYMEDEYVDDSYTDSGDDMWDIFSGGLSPQPTLPTLEELQSVVTSVTEQEEAQKQNVIQTTKKNIDGESSGHGETNEMLQITTATTKQEETNKEGWISMGDITMEEARKRWKIMCAEDMEKEQSEDQNPLDMVNTGPPNGQAETEMVTPKRENTWIGRHKNYKKIVEEKVREKRRNSQKPSLEVGLDHGQTIQSEMKSNSKITPITKSNGTNRKTKWVMAQWHALYHIYRRRTKLSTKSRMIQTGQSNHTWVVFMSRYGITS